MALSLPFIPALTPLLAAARPYVLHITLLGLSLTAGGLVGVAKINSSSDVALRVDAWQLPAVSPPTGRPPLDEDLYERFWTEPGTAQKKKVVAAKAPPAPKWRFVGTTDQGEVLLAVIEIDGKRTAQIKPGGALPDGAIVTQVSEGLLSFEREGVARSLRLFEENPSK